ncbi:MAG TPA: D-alanyl-D-alanine carboxypeptidase/D-alanyl-D-alanine-endopeptidase [Gemmatimonadales bacterium]|jgi:D-alanyl-D-alanine carboxypeptidase/D-alanyl-D-alanine-endopeptidase (penicillin-binding protein 4)|nr:D-alanyl-D-alanine carboxypeptidase/D-alanyl-D-alanine-endopeptidase [Gemmatimonadales bacterium]HEV8598642.1 D-alanyl-D-alanine carboxypeptidase/D-alanyl-D-alanine-endopeptidase [Gemmatimonadales bacterium]
MKLGRASIVLLLAASASPVGAVPRPAAKEGRTVQAQLEAWYRGASRAAPGKWAIAVATLDGQLIWGVEPTRPMIPASTVKLFTTGFARSIVGSDARRLTRVMGSGHVDSASGTWIGTWALELNGDPTLERPTRGGPSLRELAVQLYRTGIRRLIGPFNVVSSAGQASASYPEVWSPRHKGRLFAPLIGALTLNENLLSFAIAPGKAAGKAPTLVAESPAGVGELVEIRARTVVGRRSRLHYARGEGGRYLVTGTIGTRARIRWFTTTAPDPRALLEASWARALRDAGVEWIRASGISAPVAATAPFVLAQVSSEPFDSIASEVNRRSLNIGAELMLLWAAGDDRPAEQLTAHVQQITGEQSGIRLVDGSGLSHEDRVTPLAFISYLARFPLSPAGRGFSQLLPSNGVGTLRKLARGLPGPGVVRAKTGTLGDVATVTGYLGRPEGVLLISLMYNGPRVWSAKQQQWKLFRLLGAEGVTIPDDSVAIATQLGGEEPVRRPEP